MQKLLTIVVPVYKVEPYINKCLDSCVLEDEKMMNQLEVIIVNDGTPDNSAEMSREYVKRYPKTFRQIDKENGGHGSAWNVGLKEATGKYLRFLDSDDWLINLDKLMFKLQATDADLVFTPVDIHYLDKNEEMRASVEGAVDNVESIAKFPYQDNWINICNFQYCTYKTHLLQPLFPLFDEKVFYDDTILYIVPQMVAKSFVIFDFSLYQYLVGRAGQTMDPKVKSRNGKFLLQQYQKMRVYKCKWEKSQYVTIWIDYLIEQFAIREIIGVLSCLQYKQAKEIALHIKNITSTHLDSQALSKQAKRFYKMPFPLFYVYERIRDYKNKYA